MPASIIGRGHPERVLPRLEQLAPPIGPIRQAQRDVAQVDEQATQPTCHLDREMPSAAAEPDRVAEPELGACRLARRQVDELEAARQRGRARSSRSRRELTSLPALRPARTPPGVIDAAERREQVVDEVGDQRRRSVP